MQKSNIDPKIIDQIKKLEAKFEVMGQDLSSYLDGLLYADYLTYWDYIHLDTLLSLQNPKTGFDDELIFITYHQHTELFFKLTLHEIDQIISKPKEDISREDFIQKLDRINRYFGILENSFDVMVEGMDKEQFLKFRMSLLPASGFQSAQYRLIELSSTDVYNLVDINIRKDMSPNDDTEKLLDNIYWKSGATELASGKKTLTLRQFEEKYFEDFIKRAKSVKEENLFKIYKKHFAGDEEIKGKLREYDVHVNISWPLSHYRSAVKHLQKDPVDIAATGGTNWQKFLPPRFQKIIFFPELWSDKEKEEWGKTWVVKEVFGEKG